jgi:hypothetical protein
VGAEVAKLTNAKGRLEKEIRESERASKQALTTGKCLLVRAAG